MRKRLACAIVVMGALLACKDSKPVGSCDRRTVVGWESCFDYPKGEAEAGKRSCSSGSDTGTWTDAACSRAGSMGGCTMNTGITKWFFAGTRHKDVTSAKLECSGKWIEP